MAAASLAIALLAVIITAIGTGYAVQSARSAGRSATAAEESIREAQIAPVRQKQYELLDDLAIDIAALVSQLEAVNIAVQQEDGAVEARSAAAMVEDLVQRMTTPVRTDAELERRLENLKGVTIASDGPELSLVQSIQGFAGLMDRLREVREPIQARQLEQLAGQRGAWQEPLRRRNSLAIEAANQVRERLREIQRSGLGEL
jgi:hypothetical protein